MMRAHCDTAGTALRLVAAAVPAPAFPPGPTGWTSYVLPDVVDERHAQHARTPNHDPADWLCVLVAAVVELAETMRPGAGDVDQRSAAVRAAAAAVAIVETIDSRTPATWPTP